MLSHYTPLISYIFCEEPNFVFIITTKLWDNPTVMQHPLPTLNIQYTILYSYWPITTYYMNLYT